MGSGAHERKSQSNYVNANDKNYFDGDVDARTVGVSFSNKIM